MDVKEQGESAHFIEGAVSSAPGGPAAPLFVLVNTSHPGNVGAAARAIKTMGFAHLALVAPRFADVLQQPEALALASGADDVLRNARQADTLVEAAGDCGVLVALSSRVRDFGPPLRGPDWLPELARDFLLGAGFAGHTGAQLLPDPCVLDFAGQRILLSHGDALCLADTAYLQWRALCRSPQWQAQFLAQPLGARRRQAAAMRAQSQAAQGRMETWSDADAAEAARWLDRADCLWMIHGHTHRPREHWGDGRLRQVLSDWDLDHAASRAGKAQVLTLRAGDRYTAVERHDLA